MKKLLLAVACLFLSGSAYCINQPNNVGAINVSGVFQSSPTTISLSSFSVISPTTTVYVIMSTGANINMAGSGTNNLPVIATATALSGQMLVLISTFPAGLNSPSVTLTSGTASGLHLGAATRIMTTNSVLILIYNTFLKVWQEISFTAG